MTQPGESPETVAETPAADGLAVSAPMEMGDACQAAAVMAVAHGEAEGRKVGM